MIAVESWQERYAQKLKTPRQALKMIEQGDRIFFGSGTACPRLLKDETGWRADEFVDTRVVHLLTLGEGPDVEPGFRHRFRYMALRPVS